MFKYDCRSLQLRWHYGCFLGEQMLFWEGINQGRKGMHINQLNQLVNLWDQRRLVEAVDYLVTVY